VLAVLPAAKAKAKSVNHAVYFQDSNFARVIVPTFRTLFFVSIVADKQKHMPAGA
jgi:hypothetical protein